jgi:glutamate synthase domain-containing protein 2
VSNLYRSYAEQLSDLLRRLGLHGIRELRGRTDLLLYRNGDGGSHG